MVLVHVLTCESESATEMVFLIGWLKQFARIHTSSLVKTEKTLNRPITKFYNGDDVNVITAELRLTKTRPTSFNMKHNLL